MGTPSPVGRSGLPDTICHFSVTVPPLDLEAKAAHAQQPEGEVHLRGMVVPFPLVVGEAGPAAGLDCVKDAGFRLTLGIGAVVWWELLRVGLHYVLCPSED